MKTRFLAVSLFAFFPLLAQAASFDCSKAASVTEKLICNNETVSKLDEQLAGSYKQALANTPDPDSIKKAQIEWLKQQRACKDVGCLTKTYETRIAELNNISGNSAQAVASVSSSITPKATAQSDTKTVNFKFISGNSYPICKPYLDMLQAAKYVEPPACERKILPNFPQFKKIDWVEITDKNEMKKIVEERLRINMALTKVAHDDELYNAKTMNRIMSGELKMYFYKMDIDKDGVEDIVYKTTYFDKDAPTYKMCTDENFYYVAISGMTVQSAVEYKYDPYSAFNFEGSNDLFIFNGDLYVSNWSGAIVNRGINLEIYGAWAQSICGFYVN